jgi:hypothetical protein
MVLRLQVSTPCVRVNKQCLISEQREITTDLANLIEPVAMSVTTFIEIQKKKIAQ